jgi:hypothetical protein
MKPHHRQVYEHGIVGLNHGPSAEPFLLTFAMGYLLAQSDISLHCPATLTGAVAYVLGRLAPPALRDRYLPDLIRQDGRAWTGATWATERQGGSDMGAATTMARAAATASTHRPQMVCSNAVADIALVTARPEGARPAAGRPHLVPRLPDGSPSRHRIRRLNSLARGLRDRRDRLSGAYAQEVARAAGLQMMMDASSSARPQRLRAAAWRRAFARRCSREPPGLRPRWLLS